MDGKESRMTGKRKRDGKRRNTRRKTQAWRKRSMEKAGWTTRKTQARRKQGHKTKNRNTTEPGLSR
ncbi:MAG: hypothetical protein V1728_00640 [Candidatus Micrarchaeota archaeon]